MNYKLVVVELPDALGFVLVRTWESGEVDVDFRQRHRDVWTPIALTGGSFRLEEG